MENKGDTSISVSSSCAKKMTTNSEFPISHSFTVRFEQLTQYKSTRDEETPVDTSVQLFDENMSLHAFLPPTVVKRPYARSTHKNDFFIMSL